MASERTTADATGDAAVPKDEIDEKENDNEPSDDFSCANGDGEMKSAHFARGEHTLKVPMTLFEENRKRLGARLRSNADLEQALAGYYVVLKGGDDVPFNDTDTNWPFRQACEHSYFVGAGNVYTTEQGYLTAELITGNTEAETFIDCTEKQTSKQPIEVVSENTNSRQKIISPEGRLIEEVRSREALWNLALPLQQRRKPIRSQLWEDVSRALNGHYTAEEAKKKWKNLSDSFRRMCMVEKTRKKSSRKHIKWQYYDQMEFIKDLTVSKYYSFRRNFYNVEEDVEVESNRLEEIDEMDREFIESNSFKKIRLIDDPLKQKTTTTAPHPKRKNPSTSQTSRQSSYDEIRGFCIIVEKKLRKLSEETGRKTMLEIYKLLFDAESSEDI